MENLLSITAISAYPAEDGPSKALVEISATPGRGVLIVKFSEVPDMPDKTSIQAAIYKTNHDELVAAIQGCPPLYAAALEAVEQELAQILGMATHPASQEQ